MPQAAVAPKPPVASKLAVALEPAVALGLAVPPRLTVGLRPAVVAGPMTEVAPPVAPRRAIETGLAVALRQCHWERLSSGRETRCAGGAISRRGDVSGPKHAPPHAHGETHPPRENSCAEQFDRAS